MKHSTYKTPITDTFLWKSAHVMISNTMPPEPTPGIQAIMYRLKKDNK